MITGEGISPVTDSPSFCWTNNATRHNDVLVDSDYYSLRPHSEEAKAFQNGTTPVVTVFFNVNSTLLETPELYLSCLKSIPKEEQQVEINEATRSASSMVWLLMFASLAAALLR